MQLNIQFKWVEGHPAGWTDDLGIIADRNQWVNEVLPGYYCFGIEFLKWNKIWYDIRDWCDQNLTGDWDIGAGLRISERDDVATFMLAWDGQEVLE